LKNIGLGVARIGATITRFDRGTSHLTPAWL
jgi:hypothetical protein